MLQGSLSKWTNVMKGWQYRWFVLDDNAGLFSYYTSKEKMIKVRYFHHVPLLTSFTIPFSFRACGEAA